MADAPDALTDGGTGGLMAGYVCSVCGMPTESEPCREHQPAAFLAIHLGDAHEGARCKVDGFTDWVANRFGGWIQDGTGYMVSHLVLAEFLIAAGFQLPEPQDSGKESS